MRRTVSRMSESLKGLATKSNAPLRKDSFAVSSVAKPVMTTTPVSGASSLTRDKKCMPSTPSIFRSVMTMSKRAPSTRARALALSVKVSTS